MRYKIYEIRFTDASKEQYYSLPEKLKRQVSKKLERIAKDPYTGKPLQASFKGLFSYRVGKLRIIYKIDREEIVIIVVGIGFRKHIYQ